MTQAVTIERVNNILCVRFPYDQKSIAAVKSVGFARWNSAAKQWELPYSRDVEDKLTKLFPAAFREEPGEPSTVEKSPVDLAAEETKYLPIAKDVKIVDFKFKTEPMWHQKVTFNFCRALDQSAIFLQQGLGKSKCFIDLATWRFRKGQVRLVLVVAPNSVTGAWVAEVKKHGHDDFNQIMRLDGPTSKKIKQLEELVKSKATGFVVVNYEALLGLFDYLIKAQAGGGGLFQMIGLDESSRIKHAQAKRSRICWQLGKTVKYRNILTGTPITQNGEDIFSQYRFLDTSIFGPYATAFRGQYLIMGGFEQRQVIGYRNFPEFLKRVYAKAIRFTKDRCLDLPPKVYQKRVIRLSEEMSKKYRQMERECVAEFGGAKIAAPLIMTKLLKLSQVTGGFVYEHGSDGHRIATHEFDSNPKLDDLQEFLDEIGSADKVIIWCRFTQEILSISASMRNAGIRFVAIHGEVPADARAKAVQDFQEDHGVRVFLGQVATAGLGITLTAAKYVYYFSNSYALEDRLQSEDRCHRIGLQHSVTYVDCIAETHDGRRTIDHDVLAILKGKESFANEVSMALMQKMTTRYKPVDRKPGRPVAVEEVREETLIDEEDSF